MEVLGESVIPLRCGGRVYFRGGVGGECNSVEVLGESVIP